jgi:signal transduction histidine kinase
MGLAIARGIVEAHGGRIWNEDNPTKRGSRFLVTLPISEDDEIALESVRLRK